MKMKHYSFLFANPAKTTLLLLSVASLIGAALPVSGASVSELLEKGIYTEETKGDLDGAIQLYQQVVSEGKTEQAIAAQAQYRLGVCNHKKKNYTAATAAFEKLLRDYPEQKELVARASDYLAKSVTLLPAPWVDGEEMRLDIKFPSGLKLGMADYFVDSGESNGQKIWRVGSHMFAGVQSISRVEVEADSMKPLHSRWKHPVIADADTVYSSGHATLKLASKDSAKTIDLAGVVYDNEEAIQLFRRLPLAAGYKTTLNILASLSGGNLIPLGVEVVGQEKVETAAGTYDCYKVELSIHQTFWYSTDEHHYLVKFEAGGITAELSEVRQRKAGEPVKFQNAGLNLSLSAPADWVFYHGDADTEEKVLFKLIILDPEAIATGFLMVQSLNSLKPEAQKSAREWAQKQLANDAKEKKDVQVRPESWTARNVAGQPGVSVITDYTEGKEKQVSYSIFSLGSANASRFLFMVEAKDFDRLRPKFDAIVNSYQAK
jgi:tetratricopeptide (TPR) repeat protein